MEVAMLGRCVKCDYINCICKDVKHETKNGDISREVNGDINGEVNGENSSEGEPQDASEIYFACTANIYEGKCRLLQFQNAVER